MHPSARTVVTILDLVPTSDGGTCAAFVQGRTTLYDTFRPGDRRGWPNVGQRWEMSGNGTLVRPAPLPDDEGGAAPGYPTGSV